LSSAAGVKLFNLGTVYATSSLKNVPIAEK